MPRQPSRSSRRWISACGLPDVVKFNSLIGTQHGDTKKAEEICKNMKLAGDLPNVVTFSSLCGGGGTKHGATKKAEKISEKMRSAGKLPDAVCMVVVASNMVMPRMPM